MRGTMLLVNAMLLWLLIGAAPEYRTATPDEPLDAYRAMPGCGGYCW